MPDARCTRGLVCKKCTKKTHTSIQVQRRQSGIPCAMVLRLMPRSPRRRIRLVTVAGGLNGDQARLGRYRLRRLDTSNGCQDHTVLPSASIAVRLRAVGRSRETRPATTITRPTLPRPPHPAPTFVTMANAPLSGRDGGGSRIDLGLAETRIFFRKGLDHPTRLERIEEITAPRLCHGERGPETRLASLIRATLASIH
jgi:hypothetical protein